MTGAELRTFCINLNGGAEIDSVLLEQFVNIAKSIIEGERDWMVLRKTDTSKSITPSSAWDTAIDVSTITDFSKYYGDYPIRIFDGSEVKDYIRQIPWESRLENKNVSGTFVYDANGKRIFINGTVANSGTLYQNYIASTADIDLESTSDIWTVFPSRFAPMLGFYAIGVYKGAVDYDSINKEMLPANQGVMLALKNAMEKWDTDLQQSAIEFNDPSFPFDYPRSGAIQRD